LFVDVGFGDKKGIVIPVESEKSAASSTSAPPSCLCVNAIHLDAAGIDLEDKSPFFVVERVEINGDDVISENVIPFCQTSSNRVRIGIISPHGDVQIFAVGSDPS